MTSDTGNTQSTFTSEERDDTMETQEVINAIKNSNEAAVKFRHIVKAFDIDPNDRQKAKPIDKILQKLRGAGKISYHNKHGWRLEG